MKRILCLLLIIWMAAMPAAGQRKKVGVVLGGGGAKGVAHIGALKVLEEAGIPVDYVVGTSMGAIVGGLYAVGYTPWQIDSMVFRQDWPLLLSDRVKRSELSFPEKENSERYVISLPIGKEKKDRFISGMIKGQNLQNLFSNLTVGYHDSVDFNTLKIPFACVAVDLVSGKDYVFHDGSLPLAMRASMAIPAVFTPVRLDSMVLVDGGLNNNYPVDVALAMGAEVIIGVDLRSSDLKELERLNNPADIIAQIVALHGHDKYTDNIKHTDLLIRPDTSPYGAASFGLAPLDTMIDRGEVAARSQWDELIALKQKIGVDALCCDTTVEEEVHPLSADDLFYIRNISFDGVNPEDEQWLKKISKLKENSYITLTELQQAMSILIGTDAYSNVGYKLTGDNQQDLVLIVQEKSISSVNVGVRFDTEEIVAVLLNATLDFRDRNRNYSRLAFTGRVGKTSSARLDYHIERTPLRNFNLAYKFTYNDLDVYHHGKKTYNTSYSHHLAEFGYSDMNWLNFKFQIGLRYEYYDYNSFLYTGDSQDFRVKPDGFISYFALAHLETLDRRYFPTKGVSLRADYSFYTDNFVSYKGRAPFSALGVNFISVLPLTSHLSLLPSLDARVLIGGNLAYPYLNAVGGEMAGKYVPQQLPFAGINRVEILNNTVAIARLNLRQRIGERNYISLILNCGVHHDSFWDLLKGNYIWGGSIGYAYNSLFGPMNANFGMSNRNTNVQFYLNLGYSF